MMMFILLVSGLLASSVDAAVDGWSSPTISEKIGDAIHDTSIPENTPTGPTGVTITATSDEASPTITYALINQKSPALFTIASDTGVVSITADLSLDYESTTKSYDIEVTAIDGTEADDKTPTAIATVTINVGDVGPKFAKQTETVCFQQGSTAETTTITATEGDTNSIKYSITNYEAPNDVFSIAVATGIVTVATGKNIDQAQSYTLTIQATDDKTPVTTTLVINVGNCDSDNPDQTTTTTNNNNSATMLSSLSFGMLLGALVVSIV